MKDGLSRLVVLDCMLEPWLLSQNEFQQRRRRCSSNLGLRENSSVLGTAMPELNLKYVFCSSRVTAGCAGPRSTQTALINPQSAVRFGCCQSR